MRRPGDDRVAPDVPAGHLGVEGAGHPDGGRQRAGVGGERVAGAEQLPVRPEDRELLGGRDELAPADRPRQRGAVVGRLDLSAIGQQAGRLQLFTGTAVGTGRVGWTTRASTGSACRGTWPGRTGPQGRRRRWRLRPPRPTWRRHRRSPPDGPRPRRPRSRRGGSGRVQAEPAVSCRATSECSCCRRRLGRAGLSRSAPPHPVGRALDQLQRIGRPRRAAAEGADHEPRSPLAGHVLPHGDGEAVVGRLHRRDVEVLADVVLVGAHGPHRREARVVGQRPHPP